jgi:hypothetical protein
MIEHLSDSSNESDEVDKGSTNVATSNFLPFSWWVLFLGFALVFLSLWVADQTFWLEGSGTHSRGRKGAISRALANTIQMVPSKCFFGWTLNEPQVTFFSQVIKYFMFILFFSIRLFFLEKLPSLTSEKVLV